MPGLLPDIDPDGLLEYSVVYTDRSVNHMSVSFQTVMNDISRVLGDVYNADAVVVVPGSGTWKKWKTVTETGGERTREEMLDMRAKNKTDRHAR